MLSSCSKTACLFLKFLKLFLNFCKMAFTFLLKRAQFLCCTLSCLIFFFLIKHILGFFIAIFSMWHSFFVCLCRGSYIGKLALHAQGIPLNIWCSNIFIDHFCIEHMLKGSLKNLCNQNNLFWNLSLEEVFARIWLHH